MSLSCARFCVDLRLPLVDLHCFGSFFSLAALSSMQFAYSLCCSRSSSACQQIVLRSAVQLLLSEQSSPGSGGCQLSLPGKLPRCHWARMWWMSPMRPCLICSHGVVVQNAVMPLMADGQDQARFRSATRAISLHWPRCGPSAFRSARACPCASRRSPPGDASASGRAMITASTFGSSSSSL